MVIIECCAWCGAPHPTVIDCKKALWTKEREAKAKAEAERQRMKPNSEVQLSNGELTIWISPAMLAQKGEQEVRELVRHLYASYYRQNTDASRFQEAPSHVK